MTNKTQQLINKYTERIMIDYPEADKIHLDLFSLIEEFTADRQLPPSLEWGETEKISDTHYRTKASFGNYKAQITNTGKAIHVVVFYGNICIYDKEHPLNVATFAAENAVLRHYISNNNQ